MASSIDKSRLLGGNANGTMPDEGEGEGGAVGQRGMKFTLAESFSQPKVPGGMNEDRISVASGFVAVIDGAGDPLRRTLDGLPLGAKAAEEIASVFAEADANASIQEIVLACTRRVQAIGARLSRSLDEEENVPPAASFVAVSAARRQIWRVGDCGFRAGGLMNAGPKPLERLYTEIRRYLICANIAAGAEKPEDDPTLGEVLGLLRRKRPYVENGSTGTEFDYGVVNGKAVPERFIECFELGGEPTEIILASDGYPALCSTLEKTEATLQARLRADPLCIDGVRGLKPTLPGGSFDDRSYVRLQL